jgi:hypothetical protein
VTIGTMRALGLDLDRDGDTDVADVRRLTKAQARQIFVEHYFLRPRIGALPEPLHATVFDMYVNAGANAVKILQRLLNDMGQRIAVDGVIGPETIEAAEIAQAAAPHHLCRRLRHRPAQLLLRPRRQAAGQPQIRPPAGWRQGRLDPARRGLHFRALSPQRRGTCPEDGGMGMIDGLLSLLFGGGRNAVKETVEVFRENAEAAGAREAELRDAVLAQYAASSRNRRRAATTA